jgi:hypothetical protein
MFGAGSWVASSDPAHANPMSNSVWGGPLAGWRSGGEPVQEPRSRETQGAAAGRVGLRQDVEDLVGAAVDDDEMVVKVGIEA